MVQTFFVPLRLISAVCLSIGSPSAYALANQQSDYSEPDPANAASSAVSSARDAADIARAAAARAASDRTDADQVAQEPMISADDATSRIPDHIVSRPEAGPVAAENNPPDRSPQYAPEQSVNSSTLSAKDQSDIEKWDREHDEITQRATRSKTFTFVGLSLIVIAALTIAWYFLNTDRCPSCRTRIFRRKSPLEILAKEVRYRDVNRNVTDKDGRIIKKYKETVPYNVQLVKYSHGCPKCHHNWDAERWEEYK